MNIYVGNLSLNATEDSIREAFEAFGQVSSAAIIKDKYTSESKGFGFVEMPAKQEAESAMEDLNGTDLKGKTIIVNEAKPRLENRRSGGGRYRSGGRQSRY